MEHVVIGSIEDGHYVARVPTMGIVVREPLRPHGERIGGVEIGAICERLGRPEVSGRLWNKIKRGAKKAVSKTVKAAKAVANNKVTRALYQAAKIAAPSPISNMMAAAETGAKLAKAAAKGSKKAKKGVAIAKKLVDGKISLQRAKSEARKAGLKPNTVRDGAATIVMRKSKNPAAQQVVATQREIEKVGKGATKTIRARSGRKYTVTVKAA